MSLTLLRKFASGDRVESERLRALMVPFEGPTRREGRAV